VQSDRQPVSPFSRCPCPGYSGGQDTHRLIERWCPASAITQKSLRSFSQSVLDGLGVGQGTQAGGKRPPPFYPSRLYWSSVLCSLFGWSGVELCRQLSAARYSLLSSSALKLPARAVVVLFVLGKHHSDLAAGCFCCFGLFLGWRVLLGLLVA
jgi:hypothetical protein